MRLWLPGGVCAALLATGAAAQVGLPPVTEQDCAATGMSASVLRRGSGRVIVRVENHGVTSARCLTWLAVTDRAAVRGGPRAALVAPSAVRLVRFRLSPRAGVHTLTACSTAIAPPEVHPSDDCVSGTLRSG